MQAYLPTLVWRHKKENLKKCSLRGLESRKDFIFHTFPRDSFLENLPNHYILLDIEATPLAKEDYSKGLLILDATWRYAKQMITRIPQEIKIERRSIPLGFKTAYPRRQDDCFDPERGLASIEAIYIAYTLMGRDIEGLLDNYYWKSIFLEINKGNLS